MKRIFILGVFLVLSLAIIGGLVFQSISRSGSGTIEQWIGNQLQTIANSYLNPQLKFSDLDYTPPMTVSLKDLSLRADDPANPGQTIDIIATSSATLTLAEIPSYGKPIIIKEIVLDKPLVSIVAVESGSKKFVGFSTLMRTRPTTAPATAQASRPTSRPALSDVFEMRLIRISDGRIVYNPRIAGTEPMELDQINTELNVEPSETGWYKLNTAISRKPIFDLAVAGDINLDTFSARGMNVKLAADLAQDKLSYLPPQIQQLLKRYEVSGTLNASATGELSIMEYARGNIRSEVMLRDANVTLGEYRIPVKSLDMTAHLSESVLNLTDFRVEALRGNANVQGWALLKDGFDSEINVKLEAMQIQDLLATRKESEPASLAGRLDASLYAKAPMRDVMAKVGPTTGPGNPLPANWGSATINVVDGRMVRLALFNNLTEVVGSALRLVGAGRISDSPRDKVKLVLSMEQDAVKVSEFQYIGDVIAARGTGTIGLDSALDLRLRAGPVERVQALLGDRIGGAIATVTDQILAYQVTGKLGAPKVSPVVGGGAIGNVGRGVQSGAQSVGEGIQRVGEGIGNIFKPKDPQ